MRNQLHYRGTVPSGRPRKHVLPRSLVIITYLVLDSVKQVCTKLRVRDVFLRPGAA